MAEWTSPAPRNRSSSPTPCVDSHALDGGSQPRRETGYRSLLPELEALMSLYRRLLQGRAGTVSLVTLLVVLAVLGTTWAGSEGGESCKGQGLDSGSALYGDECAGEHTLSCGDWCCPDASYTCCQEEDDAPPECCKSSAYTCYTGGGALTGWPEYNGCNPTENGCGGEKPQFCEGSRRNTCCPADETCDSYFGVAYCNDEDCPEDRQCNDGRLCCTTTGICRSFLNIEYCHEDCEAQGKETCSLQGDHYGDDPMHLCCPEGTCRHHPDGWPYCTTVVD